MPRLTTLTALLLAALWLPATLHCGLEAADIPFLTHDEHLHHHESPVGNHENGAATDHSINHTVYTASIPSLKIPPPSDSLSVVLAALVRCCTCCAIPVLSPTSHPPPPDLSVAWQFLSRAAPPARAPSLNS